MSYDLSGQHAVITGALRGLGREIALHFARAGAHLHLLARDIPGLTETSRLAGADCAAPGQAFSIYPTNLRDPDSLRRVLDALPPIDILVNNAAMQCPIGALEAVGSDAWREVFNVNFVAAAATCRFVLPGMKTRGRGKIVNVSGGGATGPRPDFSAYAASKAALVRFTETLAHEVRDRGIDANCVAPGPMNTRMLAEIIATGPEGARQEFTRALQQQQIGGTPLAKGAELITFLASAASDGITGRLLSAVWDPWQELPAHREELAGTDIYTLRRIVPEDRGLAS
jgi:3-oxoacyl-[acyl-carrier protein] reductase